MTPAPWRRNVLTPQHFARGGVTPEVVISDAMLASVAAKGFRYLRGINLEWETTRLGDAYDWSNRLDAVLGWCNNHGFTPHLVIAEGMFGQRPAKESGIYGLPDEADYKHYINAILNYVMVERGFKAARWEVGNEPGSPLGRWLTPLSESSQTAYYNYLRLYTWISEVVADFKVLHPEIDIQLGGCASGTVWLKAFAVHTEGMQRDFLSFHYYGYQNSIDALAVELESLRGIAPIYLTEWGYDPFNGTYGGVDNHDELNTSAVATDFAIELLTRAESIGIDDMLYLQLADPFHGLYNNDGTPTPIGTAIFAVAESG